MSQDEVVKEAGVVGAAQCRLLFASHLGDCLCQSRRGSAMVADRGA